jgi:hypothetical protein
MGNLRSETRQVIGDKSERGGFELIIDHFVIDDCGGALRPSAGCWPRYRRWRETNPIHRGFASCASEFRLGSDSGVAHDSPLGVSSRLTMERLPLGVR